MSFNLLVSLLIAGLFFGTSPAHAKLRVYTTTTNLRSLVSEIGGGDVEVESLTKGSQDPHYVEAKPSFMLKLSRADLLVSVGLGLEVGWLPAALGGARNSALMPGGKGSLILGEHVQALEVPHGEVSREQGDVHPEGNPHFMLDPERVISLADVVAAKLGELDPAKAQAFTQRAQSFSSKMKKSQQDWQKRLMESQSKELITYHKTLNYFLARFGINGVAQVEAKPGVPPTANHILSLIKLCKAKKISLILVENYFEDAAAKRIQKEIPGLRIATVPVAVEGDTGVSSLFDLYEHLVQAITGGRAS